MTLTIGGDHTAVRFSVDKSFRRYSIRYFPTYCKRTMKCPIPGLAHLHLRFRGHIEYVLFHELIQFNFALGAVRLCVCS